MAGNLRGQTCGEKDVTGLDTISQIADCLFDHQSQEAAVRRQEISGLSQLARDLGLTQNVWYQESALESQEDPREHEDFLQSQRSAGFQESQSAPEQLEEGPICWKVSTFQL